MGSVLADSRRKPSFWDLFVIVPHPPAAIIEIRAAQDARNYVASKQIIIRGRVAATAGMIAKRIYAVRWPKGNAGS
jgi:hypothetical protein